MFYVGTPQESVLSDRAPTFLKGFVLHICTCPSKVLYYMYVTFMWLCGISGYW